MAVFKAVLAGVNKGIEYLLAGASLLLVSLIFLQVVGRYVFSIGVGWSEELARYLFIWMVFLGGSVGIHRKAHLYIETLVKMLSPALHRAAAMLSTLLCMLLFACMIYYGIKIMALVGFQTSAGLRVSMKIPYMAIPVGGALMLLYSLADLLELCRGTEDKS